MESQLNNSSLELIKQQYLKHMVWLISAILICHSIIFLAINVNPVAGLIFFLSPALLILYVYYFLSKYKSNFILIHNLGLYTFAIYLYVFIVFFQHRNIIVFIWPSTLILSVFLFKSINETRYWIAATTLLCITTPFAANFINTDQYIVQRSEAQYNFTNISTILSCSLLIAINIIYLNKINKAKQDDLLAQAKQQSAEHLRTEEQITEDTTIKPIETDKFSLLYADIENYFKNNSKYKKADFNINTLAKDLKSNVSYISKALNTNGKTNFKGFLNNYRINDVKTKMEAGGYKKFTLKTMYSEVGFINQSTFNRVFKDIEGTTPSDYIDNLKKKEV